MNRQANIVYKALPLITIAIPTYNRASHYLPQALASARSQSYPRLDIIIADNCSADETETLVSGIADSRIRYFRHHVNIGANNNFNYCLKEAKGDYFLLLHDDDLIDDDFVETCIRTANYRSDIGIIRTGIRLIDADGQVLRESPNLVSGYPTDAFFRGWFAGKAPLYLANMLLHTARLREVGGFRSKHNLYNDSIAAVRLAARYGRVDVQEIKASARLHKSRMGLAAEISAWCEDSLLLLDLMCELVAENRTLVRHEGMRFFSRANYNRANMIDSPFKRFMAHLIVFRKFNYRYPSPSLTRRIHPRRFRRMKVKMKQLLLRNSINREDL